MILSKSIAKENKRVKIPVSMIEMEVVEFDEPQEKVVGYVLIDGSYIKIHYTLSEDFIIKIEE